MSARAPMSCPGRGSLGEPLDDDLESIGVQRVYVAAAGVREARGSGHRAGIACQLVALSTDEQHGVGEQLCDVIDVTEGEKARDDRRHLDAGLMLDARGERAPGAADAAEPDRGSSAAWKSTVLPPIECPSAPIRAASTSQSAATSDTAEDASASTLLISSSARSSRQAIAL